MLLRIQD